MSWSSGSPLSAGMSLPQSSSLVGVAGASPHLSPNQPGLCLSPAAQTFPQRLVDRIRAGHFVEMRELLADNILLLQQLESLPGSSPGFMQFPAVARPRLREVRSMTVWLYCFLAYMAIRTTDPATRDQLAYARLLLWESNRHNGSGWLEYDRAFRQQASLNSSVRWNTLVPGLVASTMLAQRMFCPHCHEVDHPGSQCALAYLHQLPSSSSAVQPASRPQRHPESRLRVCISWNKGSCIYPGTCSYRHICATCQRQHRAKDCPDTPVGSEYKPRGAAAGRRLPPPVSTPPQV